MPHVVFISHSSKDMDIATSICSTLESENINCWISSRDISSGTIYPTAIKNAILECKIFLLVLSSNSDISNHVKNEVSIAADNNISILPFVIENYSISDEIDYYIRRYQWLSAYNHTIESIQKLPEAIKESINKTKIVRNIIKKENNSLYFKNGVMEIKSITFIPFYVGYNPLLAKEKYLNFDSCSVDFLKIIYFNDGFAVGIQENTYYCSNVPDYLLKRRQSHLSILQTTSNVTKILLNEQEKNSSNPILSKLPESISYVMSIHYVDNSRSDFSNRNLFLMAEPSIIGITDNETETIDDINIIIKSWKEHDFDTDDIFSMKSNNLNYYISWSNVIIEIKNKELFNLKPIIELEIMLQKLWYKIYLYSESLSAFHNQIDCFDETIIENIKKEILKVKFEYSNFKKINATDSTHINKIKKNLILTSDIDTIINNLRDNCLLFDELENIS